MNLVAVLDERGDQAGGRLLDSAVEHERPRDDKKLHCSGGREAGLDRGWPDTDATRLRTPVLAFRTTDATRLRTPVLTLGRPGRDSVVPELIRLVSLSAARSAGTVWRARRGSCSAPGSALERGD